MQTPELNHAESLLLEASQQKRVWLSMSHLGLYVRERDHSSRTRPGAVLLLPGGEGRVGAGTGGVRMKVNTSEDASATARCPAGPAETRASNQARQSANA